MDWGYAVVSSVKSQTIGKRWRGVARVTSSKLPGGGSGFQGSDAATEIGVEARTDVLDHSIATEPRLYRQARPLSAANRLPNRPIL